MNIIDKTHPLDELKNSSTFSLFLAGPCPRGSREDSAWEKQWHGDAVQMVKDICMELDIPPNITVCIPLPYASDDFLEGVRWEENYLEDSKHILFWIPRDLDKLPGFTTNVEFGEWMKSGKCTLAYPEGAPKMRYLQAKAENYNIPVYHDLREALKSIITRYVSAAKKESSEFLYKKVR